MGYSTQFSGVLKFACEPVTAAMLAKLSSFLGKDAREHPEWNPGKVRHIDLRLTEDFSGIEWNDQEKTYEMVEAVNIILREMRKQWSEFGFTGVLLAQGEEIDDRWELYFGDDGLAHERKLASEICGTRIIECPHCHRDFVYEGKATEG